MGPEICAALDWDKTRKDYIECDLRNPVRVVRLRGMITVELPLCDAHRMLFSDELDRFGGHLDKTRRVEIVKRTEKSK
jgi:predicted DNA-binding protein with PD1-like motif